MHCAQSVHSVVCSVQINHCEPSIIASPGGGGVAQYHDPRGSCDYKSYLPGLQWRSSKR